MDKSLEETSHKVRRERKKAIKREARIPSRLELWLLTEVPSYRLGLLLGYLFSIYVGTSALVAGVPTFLVTAPENWNPVWALVLVISGPIGLIGLIQDSPAFRKIELVASVAQSLTMVGYAGSALVLAYAAQDDTRVVGGAVLAWVASNCFIRALRLILLVVNDHKIKKASKGK